MKNTGQILPNKVKCPNCGKEIELEEKEREEKKFICPNCNKVIDIAQSLSLEESTLPVGQVEVFTIEWARQIENKLKTIESRLNSTESRLPNTQIISQKFWYRAWAVFGHQFATSLIFYAIILLIYLIIFLLNLLGR